MVSRKNRKSSGKKKSGRRKTSVKVETEFSVSGSVDTTIPTSYTSSDSAEGESVPTEGETESPCEPERVEPGVERHGHEAVDEGGIHNTEIDLAPTKPSEHGLDEEYLRNHEYVGNSSVVSSENVPGLGYRFRDLENEKDVDHRDLFYISSADDNAEGVQTVDSNSITYSQLSSYVLKDFLRRLQVGSMAFESKNSYARKDHDHGYQYARDLQFVIKDFPGEDTDDLVKITQSREVSRGNWKTAGEYVVSYPIVKKPKIPVPNIGEMRFLANPNLKTWAELGYSGSGTSSDPYRINQGNKNYWVYPDGSYVAYDQKLSGAYAAFGGSSQVFKLPDIRQFLSLNPGSGTPYSVVG